MTRQEWNSLTVGDYVLVHDETDHQLPAVPGRVIEVEPAKGSNVLSIRIKPVGARSTVVQPKRLAVHAEEADSDRRCWRCDVHAHAEGTPAK